MKHIGLATFAAALLLSATAFAADPHHGGGAPHGGAAPHMGGGGGAPHMGGGGMPHGGGFAHGGGMASFSHAAPSHSFAAGEHRGGFASFSHAAPSHSFAAGEHRGGFASFSHAGSSRSGFSEHRGTYASFSHGTAVQHGTATFRAHARGMEAPRGSMASYAHTRGSYGGMEHAGAAATGGGPQHYARDSRGYGTRPSNWNSRPRNFDRGSYQRNVSASARFHYGSYRAPAGYHYQRWTYGEYLPSLYWGRDYWLSSWWMFDLPIPPYGYEWVRYGDDAILVNVDTGQILQVDYGVFY